jgi:hypothetical protein
MSYKAILTSSLLVASVLSGEIAASSSRVDWRARTIEDVTAARAVIERQSPAAVDVENPAMQAWHREGHRQALQRAASVNSEAGWRYTLQAFVHGYGDPHLSFSSESAPSSASHPGFVASLIGDEVRVTWTAPDQISPQVGDVIGVCDGLSIEALIDRNVFPFALFSSLPADRRRAVTRLFVDRENPFAPPPAACSFNGSTPQELNWRPASDNLNDAYWEATRSATIGPRATGGVAFPAEGVTWVGVPSFAPVGDDADALSAAIRILTQRGDALRAGRAIVLDLRGNTGGTSMMGENLANAVWGSAIVTQYRRQTHEAVDWRASPENARYVGRFSLLLRLRFPNSDVGRTWADVIAPGLRAAHRRGEPFFRQGTSQPSQSGGASANRTRGAPSFPARVIFLTNGTCASACLDFADIALNIPGTIHVGEHTAGDGLLMEVRSVDLPSGRGSITTPIKVVRGRSRGSMESYAPDIAYNGPWIDEEVRAWVLNIAERGAF